MERPKHRRLILTGLVLLAAGALLLGRHWFFNPSETAPLPTPAVAPQPAQAQPDDLEPLPVQAALASAAARAPAPSTNVSGFRGRVIDAVTRRPIKEFEVRLVRVKREGYSYAEDEPITKPFHSETGRFAWNDIPPARWRGTLTARGYQSLNIDEFKIVAGKTMGEVLMPLLRGYTVRGRVFDKATGAGIAGASVRFKESNGWRGDYWPTSQIKTTDDGSFLLDGVPGGEIKLIAGADDRAHRELDVTVDEKTPPQEIALSSGGTIAGIVTTTTGEPLKREITLQGPYIGYGNMTNESGRFAFKNMPSGRYVIAAGTARQEFLLGPDERKEDIVLTVAPGRTVRGVVRGLRPEQLQRTHISLQAGSGYFSARADGQGGYAFNGVPPGSAQLMVFTQSRQIQKKIDVPADQDVVVDIVFPLGVRLSGRVTKGGEPAANGHLTMQLADTKMGTIHRARTSEEGTYEFEGVTPGEYRLRAQDDISRLITIASDTVLNIDIPSVQLGGRVHEDDGTTPIVGADVNIRGTDPATARVYGIKVTDNLGRFSLTGLEPGEIVLSVYKPGYEMYREKISYGSPITNKTITLRKGGGIEVRVQSASREPVRKLVLTEKMPGNDWDFAIYLWISLNTEGVGYVPSALAGSTLKISGSGDKEILIEEWDGQPLELKL